jgi:hypothetical protein
MLIADFDASTRFVDGHKRTGIGYIIRDTSGVIIKKGCKSIKAVEPNKAEYLSLLHLSEVLKVLKPMGMIIIRGDNQSVITHSNLLYNNEEEPAYRTYYSVVKKIINNLKSIPKLHPRFFWIPRDKNKRADKMAGLASGKYTKINFQKDKNHGRPNSTKWRRKPPRLSSETSKPSAYTYDI